MPAALEEMAVVMFSSTLAVVCVSRVLPSAGWVRSMDPPLLLSPRDDELSLGLRVAGVLGVVKLFLLGLRGVYCCGGWA